ncbi:hypothetical protein [Akkermansia muciniphila]|uniref:hypothetical protein n=1 Tax=Akkermansia muciniphila TaxID=239935 RepID=UPI000B8E54D7|nr:hypothetical protein [Akkermansia muciniphila]
MKREECIIGTTVRIYSGPDAGRVGEIVGDVGGGMFLVRVQFLDDYSIEYFLPDELIELPRLSGAAIGMIEGYGKALMALLPLATLLAWDYSVCSWEFYAHFLGAFVLAVPLGKLIDIITKFNNR